LEHASLTEMSNALFSTEVQIATFKPFVNCRIFESFLSDLD